MIEFGPNGGDEILEEGIARIAAPAGEIHGLNLAKPERKIGESIDEHRHQQVACDTAPRFLAYESTILTCESYDFI